MHVRMNKHRFFQYADPLLNLLDKKGNFRIRLFREACIFKKGFYMKNLDLLGRELSRVIILDNSPHSYLNHKQNAVGFLFLVDIITWFVQVSKKD